MIGSLFKTGVVNDQARFLSFAQSKLRLWSANHRTGYFSNLACDWLIIVGAYSEQDTENGPWPQDTANSSNLSPTAFLVWLCPRHVRHALRRVQYWICRHDHSSHLREWEFLRLLEGARRRSCPSLLRWCQTSMVWMSFLLASCNGMMQAELWTTLNTFDVQHSASMMPTPPFPSFFACL